MAKDIKVDVDLGIERNEYGERGGRRQRAVLTLDTGKAYNGGIESHVRVFWLSEHSRSHAFGLAGGGDFSKDILKVPGVCTQRKIDAQHAAVFTAEAVAALVKEALLEYDGKPGIEAHGHTADKQCTVLDGMCVVCGADHTEPCPECGRRAFHTATCGLVDNSNTHSTAREAVTHA